MRDTTARPATRPDLGPDLLEAVDAAAGPLFRTAWLLTGSVGAATRLVESAVTRSVVSGAHAADALSTARRVVATAPLAAWGTPDRERPTGTTPAAPGAGALDPTVETRRWLAGLPDRQRRLVVLHLHDGLSPQDTADLLGTTAQDVTALTTHALAALQELTLAHRAHLGGFTRPGSRATMAPTPARGPDALDPGHGRDRLTAILPPDPALDLGPAVRHGRRTVRRRRVARAAMAAAAVVAIVTAGAVLGDGRLWNRPAPVSPYGPAATAVLELQGSVDAQGPGLVATRRFEVSLGPVDDTGHRTVRYAVAGQAGVLGPTIDEHRRRTTWRSSPGSPVLLGVIPSGAAQDRLSLELGGGGPGTPSSWTTTVVQVPGTDYSAFVVVADRPLAGDDPVTRLLWFDQRDRPVDPAGEVGVAAQVGPVPVWISPDRSTWSVDGGELALGPDVQQTGVFVEQDQEVVIVRVPTTLAADSDVVAEVDGDVRAVASADLGEDLAVVLPVKPSSTTVRVATHLTTLRWTDGSGRPQERLISSTY